MDFDGRCNPSQARVHAMNARSGPPPSALAVGLHGRRMGIAAAVGDHALAVERFDRGPGGRRIHMEDFAQVFGLYPERKYGQFVSALCVHSPEEAPIPPNRCLRPNRQTLEVPMPASARRMRFRTASAPAELDRARSKGVSPSNRGWGRFRNVSMASRSP